MKNVSVWNVYISTVASPFRLTCSEFLADLISWYLEAGSYHHNGLQCQVWCLCVWLVLSSVSSPNLVCYVTQVSVIFKTHLTAFCMPCWKKRQFFCFAQQLTVILAGLDCGLTSLFVLEQNSCQLLGLDLGLALGLEQYSYQIIISFWS